MSAVPLRVTNFLFGRLSLPSESLGAVSCNQPLRQFLKPREVALTAVLKERGSGNELKNFCCHWCRSTPGESKLSNSGLKFVYSLRGSHICARHALAPCSFASRLPSPAVAGELRDVEIKYRGGSATGQVAGGRSRAFPAGEDRLHFTPCPQPFENLVSTPHFRSAECRTVDRAASSSKRVISSNWFRLFQTMWFESLPRGRGLKVPRAQHAASSRTARSAAVLRLGVSVVCGPGACASDGFPRWSRGGRYGKRLQRPDPVCCGLPRSVRCPAKCFRR